MSLKLKLAYKGKEFAATVPANACFGELKKEASSQLQIEAQYLKLLFRGREKRDTDSIALSGVKNGAVINAAETTEYMRKRAAEIAAAQHPAAPTLPARPGPSWPTGPSAVSGPIWPAEESIPLATERPVTVERPVIGPQPQPAPELSLEEATKADEEQMLAHIARIHADVDTLIPRIEEVPAEVDWDAKTKGKAVLAELLTRHLLTLDGIKAQGYRETAPHVRAARKAEIVRINLLHDKLETL